MCIAVFLGFLNIGGNRLDVLEVRGAEDIADIAEGAAEDPRNAGHLDDERTVAVEDLVVAVVVAVMVFPAGVAAMVPALPGSLAGGAGNQQVGPHPIDIDIAGVVEHIGGVAAGRPHIDFEGDVAAGWGLKEFDVEKSLPDFEGPDAVRGRRFPIAAAGRGGNNN